MTNVLTDVLTPCNDSHMNTNTAAQSAAELDAIAWRERVGTWYCPKCPASFATSHEVPVHIDAAHAHEETYAEWTASLNR